MDEVAIGESGLKVWRAKVADVVAPRAKRSRFARSDSGCDRLTFLVLSIVYVVGAIRDIVANR